MPFGNNVTDKMSVTLKSFSQDTAGKLSVSTRTIEIVSGEIYVSPSLVSMLDIELEDEIVFPISRAGGDVAFTVKGFYEDPFLGSSMVGMKGFLLCREDHDTLAEIIRFSDIDALVHDGAIFHDFSDSRLTTSELNQTINERITMSAINCLERWLGQLDLRKKNWRAGNVLLALRNELDMDEIAHLSGYDRERVCVSQSCDCSQKTCRYRSFLEKYDSRRYLFQTCNHNLLLADAIHLGSGRRPILPDTCALIVDEAHKLPETVRQMFGVTL